jgi:hypothetical protein
MAYARKYTGHRIAVNVLSQEVYRKQDHTIEARMIGGFSYIYMPRHFT